MSIFSKVFGKKKTVDTAQQNQQQQQQQQAAAAGHNEQANAFDGFEIVNDILPDGAPVADVYLNVDTESKSRSHMTLKDLVWDHNVGHTWLTIKPIRGQLPPDLDAMVQPATRSLVAAHGETAMGFWPIEVREKKTDGKKMSEETSTQNAEANDMLAAELQVRQAKGFTNGGGTILRADAQNYNIHSVAFGKDTDGRVEEPDDAHKPKGRKIYRITRKQFRNMYRYINAHRNHKYNLYSYNCTTFAAHALKAADQSVPMEGMTMPTSLYEAMYKEAKKHAKAEEKAKKRGQKIDKSSVQLLQLAEGESHRKKGKTKEGPNGKDVRVKGVKEFNMPLFTDPAEMLLKKMENSGGAADGDKGLFFKLIFNNSHLRSIDAACALAEEAKTAGIIFEGERKDIVDFYIKGYNLIRDPRTLTSTPDTFCDYMQKFVNLMPSAEDLSSLMNEELAPEYNIDNLILLLVQHIMACDKTGEDFEHYIEPLLWISGSDPLPEAFVKAYLAVVPKLHNKIRPSDLNRVKILTAFIYGNEPRAQAVMLDYYNEYFNYRIENHLLTDQDLADARAFGEATQNADVISSYERIERELEVSKRRQFYGGMSNDNMKISTLPKKYVKAKKQKNAPKPDENEIVAEVYLNVDTTTVSADNQVSRSKLTTDVGHTWLTVKAKPQAGQQQGVLPTDLEAEIQGTPTGRNTVNIIRAKGETAMGFWPLQNRFVRTDAPNYAQTTDAAKQAEDAENNLTKQAEQDVRDYKGFTKGSGSVARDQTQYHGYSWHNVAGRVEEPDDNHTPKARKRFAITRKQFKKMYRYIEGHRNHFYHIGTYNCTTFATHALKEAGYKASGSRCGVCYPARLYRELYDEAKSDARHRRESKVKLLKLANNESHGEYVPGKIGEKGENVRVKGVEKFDMVEKYVDEAEMIMRKSQLDPGKAGTYAPKIASILGKNTNKRTALDAARIADEALRLKLFSPEITAAVKNLYQNYKGMLEDPQRFTSLSIAQQYDYIKCVKTIADFAHEKKLLFHLTGGAKLVIATEILNSPMDSPEYATGIKICTELLSGIWDDEFEMALETIPLNEEILNKVLDLSDRDIYTSANGLAKIILTYKENNPESAFDFVLDIFRNPQTTAAVRDTMGNVLNHIAMILPVPDHFASSLNQLKESGLMPNGVYDFVMQTIQARVAQLKPKK